ncbi:MAG: hypothetical protein IJL92_07915 [Thermoguttaceae bacterium]|nr:hypothetical protein [Thermoguttaceae bacterium]
MPKYVNQRFFDRRNVENSLYFVGFSNVEHFDMEAVKRNLEGNENTRGVAFHRCRGITDDDLEFLGTMPNLRQIYVYDSGLTGSFLRFLKGIPLRYFEWGYSIFSPENYRLLRDLSMESVTFTHSGLRDSIFEDFRYCRNLERISIEFNPFDHPAPLVWEIEKLKSFYALDCPGISSALPHVGKHDLRHLSFENSGIDDYVIETLELRNKLLGFYAGLNPGITNETCRYLANIPNLASLSVFKTSITMEGIRILSQGLAAKSLNYLDFWSPDVDVDLLVDDTVFPDIYEVRCQYVPEAYKKLKKMGFEGAGRCLNAPNRELYISMPKTEPEQYLYRYKYLHRELDVCWL